jgi:hypothetical protein
MKMSILTTLAKARLDIQSMKCSDLVAVRHTIDQVSRQWSYPWVVYELQHNLPYKTWTAGLRIKKRKNVKKRKNEKLKKKMLKNKTQTKIP